MAIAERGNVESILLKNTMKLKREFDVVVEASGSESGFETALDLLKTRGKLVLKSTFKGKPRWRSWQVIIDEITIFGSRCGMFSPALGLLKEGKIKVKDLISEEFSLSKGLEAMDAASKKEIMKVSLSMDN